ncbi:ABC transporter ATP-binding protein [Lutimonas zeaxanthinifaciens]|uniref:ABC transporter ATP-binding protein n=1 Tax=Lutimonas zeaxanthinifaciens TaxID=3060215 RepID=UPI00265CCE91|nr:ABC transporter ATP-binding protein [Lutimonas sp. YSD2104]WKK65611.1 ABC transporter ATP-binding protein [Lutimonas sp. YSD2104]
MIYCEGVHKKYGKVRALHNVSISCGKGEILGLVGANGAGKTTLFKILLGLVSADSGKVEITGEGAKKIGGIIEKPSLYPYLNAHENLRLFAKIQGANSSKQAVEASLEKVGLPLNRTDPVRHFSMGMKQRLGIAVALLNNPSCLLLDEPFSGLDPLGIEALKELILDLTQDSQMTILISSHILDVLSTVCTNLSIIHNGEIIQTGATGTILAACTKSYSLCGSDIKKASFLSDYDTVSNGDCMTISASAAEISEIIFKLSQQQIAITSCRPVLDLQQLFNPKEK